MQNKIPENRFPGYFLGYSSEMLSLALPFARREASTLRPLAVDILKRNPCLFFLLQLEG
jgi:hypothetical protein